MSTEQENESLRVFQETVYDEAYRKGTKTTVSILHEKLRRLIRESARDTTQNNQKDIRILDIGCGTGELLSHFTDKYTCYGVDLSNAAIERARGRGIQAYQHDIEKDLPFLDRYFHMIVMSEVLEHVIQTDRLLKEVWRILDEKGVFILTIPNINSPISWIMQIFLDYPPINSARYKSTHVRDFTLRTVKKALSNNGFRICRIEGTFVYPSSNRFSRFLANHIPRLSETIVFLNEKAWKPKATPEATFDMRRI